MPFSSSQSGLGVCFNFEAARLRHFESLFKNIYFSDFLLNWNCVDDNFATFLPGICSV